MTTATHHRKLKVIEFTLNAVNYEFQIQSWKLNNNTEDGDKLYSYALPAGGEFRDEAEPDWSLDLTAYADWTPDGISTYLTEHDGETVPFKLDHHPDIEAEHVHWAGTLKLRTPAVGGDARTTEMTEVTLVIIGEPVYGRADES